MPAGPLGLTANPKQQSLDPGVSPALPSLKQVKRALNKHFFPTAHRRRKTRGKSSDGKIPRFLPADSGLCSNGLRPKIEPGRCMCAEVDVRSNFYFFSKNGFSSGIVRCFILSLTCWYSCGVSPWVLVLFLLPSPIIFETRFRRRIPVFLLARNWGLDL